MPLYRVAPLIAAAAMLASAAHPHAPAPAQRYVIYLHGKIIEDEGRRPTSPQFGVYEYDAILDSLRAAGFTVLSDQRPKGTNSDSFAVRVKHEVDSLITGGVPASSITVIAFSKGAGIALLASSLIANAQVSYVFMAGCNQWIYNRPEVHLSGRILSLYEESDSIGRTCAPLFARRGPGPEPEEIELHVGLRHGTFFQPRPQWLKPAIAWARGEAP